MNLLSFVKRCRKLVPGRFRPLIERMFVKFHDSFLIVEVETTTACNRRCSYCPNSDHDRGLAENTRQMPAGLFHKLVDELAEMNFGGALHPHFYGEPLLDDRLPDLVEYARGRLPSVEIVLFTNGDLLSVDLYERLVSAGVNRFAITQHSDEESPRVRELLEWRRTHGDRGVTLEYGRPTYINSRGGLIDVEQDPTFQRPDRCVWPSRNVTIDHAGDVILCCEDYFGSVKLGNIEQERLEEIWRKPRFVQLRRDLRNGLFESEICKRCGRISIQPDGRLPGRSERTPI